MSLRSPEAKQERAARWDAGFINCTLHPNRRCNRSDFMHTGSRRCASCKAWHRATPSAREKRLLRHLYWFTGEPLKQAAEMRLYFKQVGVLNGWGKPVRSDKVDGAEVRAKMEHLYSQRLQEVLAACNGNKTEAARQLGISRAQIRRLTGEKM